MTGALPEVLLPAALRFASGPPGQAVSHHGHLLGVSALALLVVAAATGLASKALVRAWRTARRRRSLTPEKIVDYKGPTRPEETLDVISRRIVERSEQIQRALAANPSEVEVAMCAMGYSTCVDDLLVLSRLVSKRSPTSGPVRRLRMSRALHRAAGSLARTRKALPAQTRGRRAPRDHRA